MSMLRRTAKTALSSLLHYSGAYSALAWLGERMGQGGLAVLTYHRVLPREEAKAEPDAGIVTTTEGFEQQMGYIRKQWAALDLEEAVNHLARARALPRRACVITFDDGWLDTYTQAFPILQHFGLPATVFVTTQHIGTKTPLWTRRAVEVWGQSETADLRRVVPRICALHGLAISELEIPEAEDRKGILSFLKRLPSDVREEIGGELGQSAAVPKRSDPWLTWDQLREMSGNGIAVGSHTQTHACLSCESAERVREEVVGARNEIRKLLGRAPSAFCYPDGDHNPEVTAIVREAGHDLACTTRSGVVRTETDPYLLPRIDMHENAVAGLSGGFSPSLFIRRVEHDIRWPSSLSHRMRAGEASGSRRDSSATSFSVGGPR